MQHDGNSLHSWIALFREAQCIALESLPQNLQEACGFGPVPSNPAQWELRRTLHRHTEIAIWRCIFPDASTLLPKSLRWNYLPDECFSRVPSAIKSYLSALSPKPLGGQINFFQRLEQIQSIGMIHAGIKDAQAFRNAPAAPWSIATVVQERKRQGTFYTPAPLAHFLARRTFLVTRSNPIERIADPAMGSGLLLFAACFEHLIQTQKIKTPFDVQSELRRFCEQRIFGQDIDDIAVFLARATFQSLCTPAIRNDSTFIDALKSSLCVEDSLEQFTASASEPPTLSKASHIFANPPWERLKLRVLDHFLPYDPELIHLPKRAQTKRIELLCQEIPGLATDWEHAKAHYTRVSQRVCHRDGAKHFSWQDSADLNLYKLFIEIILKRLRPGGVASWIVPAGFYSDQGCRSLRRALFERYRWLELWCLENRDSTFSIDRRFKYCVSIQQCPNESLASTAALPLRVHHYPELPEAAQSMSDRGVELAPHQIIELSPHNLAIPELETSSEVDYLFHFLRRPELVEWDSSNWDIEYQREFDMTLDAELLHPSARLLQAGFRRDEYGYLIAGPWTESAGVSRIGVGPYETLSSADLLWSDDRRFCLPIEHAQAVYAPLYEGRMVDSGLAHAKSWIHGHGRQAVWQIQSAEDWTLRSQYCVDCTQETRVVDLQHPRIRATFLAISSPTNARSLICAATNGFPQGNSLPVLASRKGPQATLALAGILSSLVMDYHLRLRLSGNNINLHRLLDFRLPQLNHPRVAWIAELMARLSCASPRYARTDGAREELSGMHPANWALKPSDRRNLEIVLNILVARSLDLPADVFAELQRDCQHERDALAGSQLRNHLPRRGYWRIDADQPPSQRLPNQLYEARHQSDDELWHRVQTTPIHANELHALDTWWKLHRERQERIAMQVAKLRPNSGQEYDQSGRSRRHPPVS